MTHKTKVSPVLFGATVLCFLLPFVVVSCNGQKVASFSGAELAVGTTVQQPQVFGPPIKQRIGPEPWASVAGLCALLGLCLSFLPGARSAIAPGICGCVGVVALLVLKFQMDSEIAKAGRGMFQLEYGGGFILAMLLFAAGAAWSMYLFSPDRASAASASKPAADAIQQQTTAERASSPLARFCPECGSTVGARAKFCASCGTLMAAATTTTIAATPFAVGSLSFDKPSPSAPVASAEAGSHSVSVQSAGDAGAAATRAPSPAPLMQTAPASTRQKTPEKTSAVFKMAGAGLGLILLLGGVAAGWYLWGVKAVISTTPPDARVFLDNRELPNQSGVFVAAHLARTPHRLRILREGYEEWVQQLSFSPLTLSQEINIKLPPKPAPRYTPAHLGYSWPQASSTGGSSQVQFTTAQQAAVNQFLRNHPEVEAANCASLGIAANGCTAQNQAWLAAVRNAKAQPQSRFAVWGDFNRDGLPDFALPFFSRNSINNFGWRRWSLVVFQGVRNGEYSPVVAASDQWGLCFDGMLFDPIRKRIEYWCGGAKGGFGWNGYVYVAQPMMGD